MTRWLTRSEAAEHARMSVATFNRHVREGLFPPGHGVHKGRKVWSQDDIDAAISGKQSGVADPIMREIERALEKTP